MPLAERPGGAAQVEGACPRTPPGVACLQAKDALAEARRRLGTFLAEQDAALQKQQQETKAEAPAASEEGGCVSASPSSSFSCAAVGSRPLLALVAGGIMTGSAWGKRKMLACFATPFRGSLQSGSWLTRLAPCQRCVSARRKVRGRGQRTVRACVGRKGRLESPWRVSSGARWLARSNAPPQVRLVGRSCVPSDTIVWPRWMRLLRPRPRTRSEADRDEQRQGPAAG